MIGELLRRKRVEEIGKGLREMAGLLNTAPAHLTDIEKGRRTPSEELMMRIATHYKMPIAELRSGFNRADSIIAEVANQDATTAAMVPAFLRTARNLTSKQWDQLIEQAGKMSQKRKPS